MYCYGAYQSWGLHDRFQQSESCWCNFAAIQPMIELAIAEALNKRFAELTTVVDNLRLDITVRNVKIFTLENQNVKLCAAVDSQQQRIEALEANTRLENLVVYGLPPSYAETSTTGLGRELNDDVKHTTESPRRSKKIFIYFCHEKLRLDVKQEDIVACYRLKKTTGAIHPPLIVLFTNRRFDRKFLLQRRSWHPQNSSKTRSL